MNRTLDPVLSAVRDADPLDDAELNRWLASPRPDDVLAQILGSPVAETERRRRLTRSSVVPIVAIAAVAGGGAAAAATWLGGPAPQSVRDHLAELDRGMPADLRYDPDLEHARAVATAAAGTLYAADLPDGGYCVEVASTGGVPRGASCLHPADATARVVEVTAPIPPSASAPLLIGGRVRADVTSLLVRYADGDGGDVTLEPGGYFLLEVPTAHQESAYTDGLQLVAYADGAVVKRTVVPPLQDDAAQHPDDAQPLFVSTVSDGDDFSVVRAIQGHVNVDDFAALSLTYPDGTEVAVPVRADGSYSYNIPRAREHDFARAFGQLTASDSDGHVLATAPVASVAAWRAHEG